MRLIDAKKLKGCAIVRPHTHEDIKAIESCSELVEHRSIPTAYDVDKVLKQLEEEKEYSEADFDRYTREHYPDSDCDDWFCSGLERAIEIVKGGGVDE